MPKLLALCAAFLLVLNACANDTKYEPNASGPAGSEIAKPGPVEAGTIGH